MPLSIEQINALQFGYLSGSDLLRWTPGQLLQKQQLVFPNCLQDGCDTAYDEMISKLQNRYDIRSELAILAPALAAASATVVAGAVTAIVIDKQQTKYKSVQGVVITGGAGAGATATITVGLDGVLAVPVVTAGGAGYTSAPIISIPGTLIDLRERLSVKLAAILAVRNILGNMQGVSEQTESTFKWAETMFKEIRMQQANLDLKPPPTPGGTQTSTGDPFPNPAADAGLVCTSFKTLG